MQLLLTILLICGIDVPISVKNSIEDVFMENDNVESVDCYHLEDLDQFQNDLSMNNNIDMIVGGKHIGSINNVWTYYGDIEYSYSESIRLLDKNNNVIDDISNIESNHETFVASEKDWVVTLVERVNWGETDDVERHLGLYIYCPHSSEPDPTENIYNQIKRS